MAFQVGRSEGSRTSMARLISTFTIDSTMHASLSTPSAEFDKSKNIQWNLLENKTKIHREQRRAESCCNMEDEQLIKLDAHHGYSTS